MGVAAGFRSASKTGLLDGRPQCNYNVITRTWFQGLCANRELLQQIHVSRRPATNWQILLDLGCGPLEFIIFPPVSFNPIEYINCFQINISCSLNRSCSPESGLLSAPRGGCKFGPLCCGRRPTYGWSPQRHPIQSKVYPLAGLARVLCPFAKRRSLRSRPL